MASGREWYFGPHFFGISPEALPLNPLLIIPIHIIMLIWNHYHIQKAVESIFTENNIKFHNTESIFGIDFTSRVY